MNTTVTLGKTGITVNKNGFGALPIQRISTEEAGKLLKKAYDAVPLALQVDVFTAVLVLEREFL